MKRKFNYLKSALPALALSLVLLGGITPPNSASENSEPVPRQPVIEEENPEDGDAEGLQPLSDLDETIHKIEE